MVLCTVGEISPEHRPFLTNKMGKTESWHQHGESTDITDAFLDLKNLSESLVQL